MAGDKFIFQIEGMHCPSCAMNIDSQLEELDGVLAAKTKYASQKVVLEIDSRKVSVKQIQDCIHKMGYQIKDSNY